LQFAENADKDIRILASKCHEAMLTTISELLTNKCPENAREIVDYFVCEFESILKRDSFGHPTCRQVSLAAKDYAAIRKVRIGIYLQLFFSGLPAISRWIECYRSARAYFAMGSAVFLQV
jgi:hypothetical protein